VTATGDRANMDMDSGRGEFFGAPVDLTSPRGRMRAPHVIYTTADQLSSCGTSTDAARHDVVGHPGRKSPSRYPANRRHSRRRTTPQSVVAAKRVVARTAWVGCRVVSHRGAASRQQ
jgi:hypothetical protein